MNGIPVSENTGIFYTIIALLYIVILFRAMRDAGTLADGIPG
jgi:hypothetical protein